MLAPLADVPGLSDEVLSGVPIGRLANPDDIADVVLFLLSDASRYMTGEVVTVDGGEEARHGSQRSDESVRSGCRGS
jgi:NAD(P)-dependent dehydrogenase (short-subunit alcohol dehydrogenase family)